APGLAPKGTPVSELLNPDSLKVYNNSMIEPSLAKAKPGDRFQFMRNGYFYCDDDSSVEKPIFNRIVTLKDTWAKIARKG
ncbi:MAG: glutamine--tRNA ligase, partial [Clostridia bacterium]|nr:glutamine--tRNA ligase [Clostridia bacterium]